MAKPQTKPAARSQEHKHQQIQEHQEEVHEQLPAVQEDALPAELMSMATQDAGMGVSTDQADNLVPLVYLLQSNSPQCQRGHEKCIQGAQAGDIWLRANQPGEEIISGDQGLLFQNCFFSKDWVEWQPNRGGFVGRHADRPKAAQLKDVRGDDGNVRQRWLMPSGNVIVETRYHVGYAYMPDGRVFPYTIPLSSTGHSVSKSWMFTMNSQAMPNGNKAPAFLRLYRLVPKLQRRGPNSWFQYTVITDRWADTQEYLRGRALHEAFASGAQQIAEETSDLVDEDAGTTTSDTGQYGGHGDPGYQPEPGDGLGDDI